ncbi:hypothetical protein UG55_111122 [Frankia sp. EI5c]|uniref:hypothetical protein n=1 Tax=Frankia sp. EI5c TaxID=683316 RepID=UPI0007C33BE8|nr:hypothetical protein [Frankia sp. EI5c]OAA18454.1 hypothetical protein UG55_111122 [Frankia sp. EI5c]
MIVGDAYLAGPVRRGLDTDTPADLIAVLTGTGAVQVQTRSRGRGWTTLPSTVGTVYDEPFDAYATALLALDDPDSLDVRVHPHRPDLNADDTGSATTVKTWRQHRQRFRLDRRTR